MNLLAVNAVPVESQLVLELHIAKIVVHDSSFIYLKFL